VDRRIHDQAISFMQSAGGRRQRKVNCISSILAPISFLRGGGGGHM
jgi:hypothetical protein